MDENTEFGDLFALPQDYDSDKESSVDTTKTTRFTTSRNQWAIDIVTLAKKHSLWGHEIWNASKVLADYLEDHNKDGDNNEQALIRNKSVLEFGAGGALPSLLCAKLGAKKVVVTDYPDIKLINCIKKSVEINNSGNVVDVTGYLWGRDSQELTSLNGGEQFDVVILSDLVFNHSEHKKLLASCKQVLKKGTGVALVFFTHHRPWLVDKDMDFFKVAESEEFGFTVEEVASEYVGPMFKEDPGDETIRGTVHGYTLRH
ncbi:Protein N-methyltransferase nnt1 [Zancudomyces culisetae]|uniref:Protein N-methyltransferase nnt1 n=1 Tax=Zancudomyces culisetae TaxID=1213189 RepID=A0A1R1PI39_ZANCU|nr:Protein N-methyltransferase nnt1 [Zancudomyces culisetae]OMH80665.1 Protein N-methyltransferase nnt1 [Zancudomyces culisetae]|eukprot:OMH80105.1 Protein N-methyltransferase nnt1 [Zancudomyces culisetae]